LSKIQHQSAGKSLGKFSQLRVGGTREICQQTKCFIGAVLHRFIKRCFVKFSYFRRNLFEVFIAGQIATRCGALARFCNGLVGGFAFLC
jgi:hypothetical protein